MTISAAYIMSSGSVFGDWKRSGKKGPWILLIYTCIITEFVQENGENGEKSDSG